MMITSAIIGFTLFEKSYGIQGHGNYLKPSYSHIEGTFPSMFLPAEAVSFMSSSFVAFPVPVRRFENRKTTLQNSQWNHDL
jgi:hypothetical protein